MSKPFQIFFKSEKVGIGGNKLLYMPNNLDQAEYYFDRYNPESDAIQPDWHSKQCPNHFKYFLNPKKSESDIYTHFIC